MWKNISFVLLQLMILWAIHQLGLFLTEWASIPLPGNVLGMVILFILLVSGIIPITWIERGAKLLIKHLTFFFIPICVGLMTLGHMGISEGIFLMFVIMLSTCIGIIVTGGMSQTISRKKEE
ncbi:CidA/LrgA family protein [Salipaludibacillus daqingensis]|uniref:CidA/LrgA family protein n=1 Tax=Salipaludibacillus daqingensis TaxID=3041001 RepID=UPI002474BDEE|nr:CidA/LrgA family protein [Salipaludibacillus daqingensis]